MKITKKLLSITLTALITASTIPAAALHANAAELDTVASERSLFVSSQANEYELATACEEPTECELPTEATEPATALPTGSIVL